MAFWKKKQNKNNVMSCKISSYFDHHVKCWYCLRDCKLIDYYYQQNFNFEICETDMSKTWQRKQRD